MADQSWCERCSRMKLADGAKFRKVDGQWHTVCRECEGKAERRAAIDEKREKLRQVMKLAASNVLKANTIPHPAEMLSAIIEQSGGIQQFAIDFHLSRMATEPGSKARKDYDNAILKLVVTNAELGGARKPIDALDLAEINSELEAHLDQISLKAEGLLMLDHEEDVVSE